MWSPLLPVEEGAATRYAAAAQRATATSAWATVTLLQATTVAVATEQAASDRTTRVAASGVFERVSATKGRGTPATGSWLVAAALSLAGWCSSPG